MFEFEVWRSMSELLEVGQVAAEVVKIVVAASSSSEAYDIALDMAWRGDWQVTKVWWVP